MPRRERVIAPLEMLLAEGDQLSHLVVHSFSVSRAFYRITDSAARASASAAAAGPPAAASRRAPERWAAARPAWPVRGSGRAPARGPEESPSASAPHRGGAGCRAPPG